MRNKGYYIVKTYYELNKHKFLTILLHLRIANHNTITGTYGTLDSMAEDSTKYCYAISWFG